MCDECSGGGCGWRSGSVQTYRRRHCRAVTSRSGECGGSAKRPCPTTGTFVPIFRFSVRQSNEKGAAARGLAGPTPHADGCREAAADRDGNSRSIRSADAGQRGELLEARRQHRRPRPVDQQMRRRARPRASLGVERNRRHRRPAHLPARGRLVRARWIYGAQMTVENFDSITTWRLTMTKTRERFGSRLEGWRTRYSSPRFKQAPES